MLTDLLTKNAIIIKEEVKNFDEALQLLAQPLIDTKKITTKYIEQVKENIKKNGAYIILKDGFALPHARPSEATLEIGMSMIVLKKPIQIENNQTQIYVLVLLAAVDSETHLDALAELITVIEDDEKFNCIQKAKCSDEIIQIIK